MHAPSLRQIVRLLRPRSPITATFEPNPAPSMAQLQFLAALLARCEHAPTDSDTGTLVVLVRPTEVAQLRDLATALRESIHATYYRHAAV